jgi:hypothetical protein
MFLLPASNVRGNSLKFPPASDFLGLIKFRGSIGSGAIYVYREEIRHRSCNIFTIISYHQSTLEDFRMSKAIVSLCFIKFHYYTSAQPSASKTKMCLIFYCHEPFAYRQSNFSHGIIDSRIGTILFLYSIKNSIAFS